MDFGHAVLLSFVFFGVLLLGLLLFEQLLGH